MTKSLSYPTGSRSHQPSHTSLGTSTATLAKEYLEDILHRLENDDAKIDTIHELPVFLTLFSSITERALARGVIPVPHCESVSDCDLDCDSHSDADSAESEPESDTIVLQIGNDKTVAIDVSSGEIDLSDEQLGDIGCAVLASSLTDRIRNSNTHETPNPDHPSLWCLDLEANGISPTGGASLAQSLREGAMPDLRHLDLSCNGIQRHGAFQLADAFQLDTCPHLSYLDLHGNAIGDDGCVALAQVFSKRLLPNLKVLDLSANRIEDTGCQALALPLFGVRSQYGSESQYLSKSELANHTSTSGSNFSCPCPLLTDLNLRENGIESIASLFPIAAQSPIYVYAENLAFLDLSWNCITNFGALSDVHTSTDAPLILPALADLDITGNSLPESECCQLIDSLIERGVTPLLKSLNRHKGDAQIDGGSDTQDTGEARGSEGQLRHCLRLLADGDVTNHNVCHLPLWENTNDSIIPDPKNRIYAQNKIKSVTLSPSQLLCRDGFIVRPSLCPNAAMIDLGTLVDHLDLNGWPPVFCFMNSSLWELVTTHIWPEVRALMGADCVLDAGSAFAWSLKPTGKTTFPRDGEFRKWQNAVSATNVTERVDEGYLGIGSSFGLPHRDYSGADSIIHHGVEAQAETTRPENKDHPALLSVWIPLNDATLNNGCMHLLPREFDAGFDQTDDHAHMNPAMEVERGVSTKIRFPLHGARPLPAKAGSLLAWYGNAVHWGSACSRYAEKPRKSIAMTFRRADTVLEPIATQNEESRIHNPAPPITREQACTMTMQMRLELISRSLLLYNQWHALPDHAVPPILFETSIKS